VRCWGLNSSGQLGDGTTTTRRSPRTVPGIVGAVEVRTGQHHTCARLLHDEVRCWGLGTSGQLGTGTTYGSTTPVSPPDVGPVDRLVLGGYHTCVVDPAGTARCWGSDGVGELGDGSAFPGDRPAPVNDLTDAIGVAVGSSHACAVRSDGTVWCWGWNDLGLLGDGTTQTRIVPVPVAGISTAVAVSAGWVHTCALLADGAVTCWGLNPAGQLGDGSTSASLVPVAVTGLDDATAVAAGGNHSCARRATGSIVCWGSNDAGQLGDGSTTSSSTPVAVPGITDADTITAGGSHTCTSRSVDASAWCWGDDRRGQLGRGQVYDPGCALVPGPCASATPAPVAGIGGGSAPVGAMVAGADHTCALVGLQSAAWCWGSDEFGTLGDGARVPCGPFLCVEVSTSPVPVTGLGSGVAAIGAGPAADSTCATTGSADVRCWGRIWLGDVADTAETPVIVPDLGSPVIGATGGSGAPRCVLDVAGTVECWGGQYRGHVRLDPAFVLPTT
jgi:alpha-tubulin suppressor-like RCC1 family protein